MVIDETNIQELPEQVDKTRQELCTWEWMFGQTPEFTHTMDNEFEWGHVNVFLRSRHGLITVSAHEVTVVSALSIALKGCRYSEQAAQDAIDKISMEIPGLINEENKTIADGIIAWMTTKLG
ncbi:unnamed protein product [Absidia cylindrospora]